MKVGTQGRTRLPMASLAGGDAKVGLVVGPENRSGLQLKWFRLKNRSANMSQTKYVNLFKLGKFTH